MISEPIIVLSNVSFKYQHGTSFAVKKACLEIFEEEFVLLVGYSGSGKSTLLKTLNGLIPHFHAGRFGGEITVNGKKTLENEPATFARDVGFVFQNPENQLSNMTVEREIAFPLENYGVPREKMQQRIEEVIELLGLENIRYKSPFEISGGEQQLAAIAGALALDPPILILDEVTANLSPRKAFEILELLHSLNKEHKKTIILSEHRIDRCLAYASKIVYLEEGWIKLAAKPQEVFVSDSFPDELLPKIPSYYIRYLQEQALIKQKGDLDRKVLPLTIEDFTNRILSKEGGKENDKL